MMLLFTCWLGHVLSHTSTASVVDEDDCEAQASLLQVDVQVKISENHSLTRGELVIRQGGASLADSSRSQTSNAAATNRSLVSAGLAELLHDLEGACPVDSGKVLPAKPTARVILNQAAGFRTSNGRRPVTWVHLHSFAGTFMCTEAIRQGERTPPEGNPSWPSCFMPSDGCSERSLRSHCEQRARSGYSFTSLERDVDDEDFCDGALMGTILRDPVEGSISTLLANAYDKSAILDILRTGQSRPADHQLCLPAWDTYQHFDNFATRSLGGGYMAPPRKVTREHLRLAKERLQRMAVVVILEEFSSHLPQFATVFGWNLLAATSKRKANKHDCSAKVDAFDESERSFLKEVNELDYELYAFAQALAANITATAKTTTMP